MQDPHLFSLSTGISEEDLGQLDTVTTRKGTRAVLPAPTGDPWQYYRRSRKDNQGDSLMEAMYTNEGRRISGQILDTARRMAAEACGEVGAAYEELTNLMPMFTASDAAIADISPKEVHKEEGDQMETTTEDSFMPFDFEEAFVARHGIKPEEADAPYEQNKRTWKKERDDLGIPMEAATIPDLASNLYPTSEMSALAIYGGQMNLDTIKTQGVWDRIEGSPALRDQYSQSTIQIDPQVLRELLAR